MCVNSSGRVDAGFTTTASLTDPIKGMEIENIAVFRSESVVEAIKPEDSTSLFIITGENRIPTVDLPTSAVTHAELAHDENSSLGQIGTLDATSDGARLFVGFIRDDEERRGFVVNEIRVDDTISQHVLAVNEPDDPPMHFAISENGQRLYIVSPLANGIAIYDITNLQLTAYRISVARLPRGS
ncbi:MAG TPA: hypothetical protein DC056_10145 [Dehalococcoidia bacterium]|nr:hypothetical protein [Dehalococcoidia bacterium]